MKFCKSSKYPDTFFFVLESKYFNLDWLSVIAKISPEKMKLFFEKSIQFSYRGLILNFTKMPTGTNHFKNKTIVTCDGLELLHIESFAHEKNVAFKHDEIRVRVANPVFYTKYTKFILKALFSKQMLETSNYRISELHIAMDSANEIYNLFTEMVQNPYQYSIAYLPKNDHGDGRKMNAHVFNIDSYKFLGYTIGSRNNDLWFSCYNKASDLKQKEKLYINNYWKKNDIEFNPQKFYRFEIRLAIGQLKRYIDITDLDILDRNNFCSLYKTIFNERLQIVRHKRIDYKFKIELIHTKTLYYSKLDSHISDRKYKEYLGYWLSRYYEFSSKKVDSTGWKVCTDFHLQQFELMCNYLMTYDTKNILFIKEKFERVTKRYAIKKLKKEVENVKNIIDNLVFQKHFISNDNQ